MLPDWDIKQFQGRAKVQVYSLLGQTCSNVHVVPGNQEFEVNIGNLSAGMYVARFSWNGKTYSKKFVVH
ncbi:MAG: T9SS type A sorting domain-containing protein [Cytophagales bacterium]